MSQTIVTTSEFRSGLDPFTLRLSVHPRTGGRSATRNGPRTEGDIDDALAASFPASDPPSWNPGRARLGPVDTLRSGSVSRLVRVPLASNRVVPEIPGVVDVSRPERSERTALQIVTSIAAATGIALLVPVVILLVGLPIVLAIRGMAEVVLWLVSGLG